MENRRKRIINEVQLELELLHLEIQRFPSFVLVRVERLVVEKRMVFQVPPNIKTPEAIQRSALTLAKNRKEEEKLRKY